MFKTIKTMDSEEQYYYHYQNQLKQYEQIMRKGIIKLIKQTGSFENSHGKFYTYELSINNGDKGTYSSKTDGVSNLKIKEGDNIEYEYHNQGDYPKIKSPKKIQSTNNFIEKNNINNKSFALSYAKDIACAHITQGKDFTAKQIIEVSRVFESYLNE